MEIAFAVEPGPQQRLRLSKIRQRVNALFPQPKYRVVFDEYRPAHLSVIIAVTVFPDPPYGPHGALFPGERAISVHWPWPENSN
jgi:hypothetical protein